MKDKITPKIIFIVVLVFGIPTIGVLAITAFYAISNPTISLDDLNKSVEYNVVSAKQIEDYLSSELKGVEKFNKYDLTVGSVDMKLDKEHRGDVTVTFVEKDRTKSKIIYATLDTRKGVFYKFQDVGRQSKLYPGIVHLNEWKIDSTDAVRIMEYFYKNNKAFRYDEIWILSSSYYLGAEETWNVYLTDRKNSVKYGTRINPYSGEVVVHTIN